MRIIEFRKIENSEVLFVNGLKFETKLSPWNYSAGVGKSSICKSVLDTAYIEAWDEIEILLKDSGFTDHELRYTKFLFTNGN